MASVTQFSSSDDVGEWHRVHASNKHKYSEGIEAKLYQQTFRCDDNNCLLLSSHTLLMNCFVDNLKVQGSNKAVVGLPELFNDQVSHFCG
jgi:hypothetical protein